MKPTTTCPATLTNSAESLPGAFTRLSMRDETTRAEVLSALLLGLKRGEYDTFRTDFRPFAHAHQLAPERANSGADWTTWLILGGRRRRQDAHRRRMGARARDQRSKCPHRADRRNRARRARGD